ncbi:MULTISPECIES: hypothetical protein [Cysteiniphilum]|uniref:YD repeat-containing protein n=1 Tax=Cysteiniphilum litorale TaxID=2056700 RepID=A0A8J2Z7E4_9GAMM|nr:MULTISPECIES: hypothetical protein [Cysteiniphilum]GGG08641.1 hypothetical protein GCM10010995_27740 [Cysteiniphilum litorale]
MTKLKLSLLTTLLLTSYGMSSPVFTATSPSGITNSQSDNNASALGINVNPETGQLSAMIDFSQSAMLSLNYQGLSAGFASYHLPKGWRFSTMSSIEISNDQNPVKTLYLPDGTHYIIDDTYSSGLRYYTAKDKSYQHFSTGIALKSDPLSRKYFSELVTGISLTTPSGTQHYFYDGNGQLIGVSDNNNQMSYYSFGKALIDGTSNANESVVLDVIDAQVGKQTYQKAI